MASSSNANEKHSAHAPWQTDETDEESEGYESRPSARRQKRNNKGAALDRLVPENVQSTAGNLVNNTNDALGGVASNATQQAGGGSGKSDTLRLRLDLNLEVEITLKAKIHGDLELALL